MDFLKKFFYSEKETSVGPRLVGWFYPPEEESVDVESGSDDSHPSSSESDSIGPEPEVHEEEFAASDYEALFPQVDNFLQNILQFIQVPDKGSGIQPNGTLVTKKNGTVFFVRETENAKVSLSSDGKSFSIKAKVNFTEDQDE